MEQHPVPQNIASFKFKLFGSLTARQFFTLIIPLSVAALIFFSNIPVFIRLPLSLILGTIAFVVALVPINGQPFDKWVVAFIRAIMSPTQRVWIKEKKIPDFLSVIVTPPVLEEAIPEELTSQKREKLFAYIKTLPEKNATPLDVKEQIALKDIDYSMEPLVSIQPFPKTKPGSFPPPIIWPASPPSEPVRPGISTTVDQLWLPKPLPSTKLPAQTMPTDESKVKLESAKPIKIYETPSPKKIPQPASPKISYHAAPYILHGVEKRLAVQPQPQIASPPSMPAPPEHQYVQLIPSESIPAFKSSTVRLRPNRPETKEFVSEEERSQTLRYGESITPSVNLASDTNYSLDNIIPIKLPNNKIRLLHGIGKTRARKLHFAPPANFDLSKLPIRGEKRFEVSDELKRHFQFEDTSPEVLLPFAKKSAPATQVPVKIWQKPAIPTSTQVVPKSSNIPLAKSASHTAAPAPIPSTQKFSVTDFKTEEEPRGKLTSAVIIPLTSTPNVISGQVTDSKNMSLAGAVIVVRDAFGIPLRALKTNKLGQFLSATPLSAGTYTIETESELAVFEPLSLELKNEIVPPIAISAEQAVDQ